MLELIFQAVIGPLPAPNPTADEVRHQKAVEALATLCVEINPTYVHADLMRRFSNPHDGPAHMNIVSGKLFRRLSVVAMAGGKLTQKRRMARVGMAKIEAATAAVGVNFERGGKRHPCYCKRKPSV